MIRLVIVGICGQMGHALCHAAADSTEFSVTAGVDRLADAAFACPIYASLDEVQEDFDAIIDFSVPAVLGDELRFVRAQHKPLVVGTTGLTQEHLDLLHAAAEDAPVFQTGNMSLGVNLQMQLVEKAASALGTGFDVEIVERHHRKKVDAPSGTALMLANAISSRYDCELEHVYGRGEKNRRRSDNEIGFHSVRGGTIVGEHEVAFIGQDEIIEITHKAFSKRIFAEGALRAAKYLMGQKNGFYHMGHVLSVQNSTSEPKINEQPAVLLTVAVPLDRIALLSAVSKALQGASVAIDLSTCLAQAKEHAALSMIVSSADLMNALEALQPLQVEHETLDVQMQGGLVLLSTTTADPHAEPLSALIDAGVQPLLCTAKGTSLSTCVKCSEKDAAIACLKAL